MILSRNHKADLQYCVKVQYCIVRLVLRGFAIMGNHKANKDSYTIDVSVGLSAFMCYILSMFVSRQSSKQFPLSQACLK